MKIGVITFWNSQDNYGQVLQCYALQSFLKKEGHEVLLIKYIPTANEKDRWALLKKIPKLLDFRYVRAYMQYRKHKTQQNRFLQCHPRLFNDFREEFISSTEKVYNGFRSLWEEDWSSFDALICGSDQVWSYSSEENLRAYFLDFGQFELKRIAYAASFGRKTLPNDYALMFPQLLSKIDSIGLRENSGVDLCKAVGRNDATLVCDPTLLLEGMDYLHNIVRVQNVETNSIFCYLLNWETVFPYEELKQFAQNESLTVNFVPAHGVELLDYFPPMDDLSIPSWLNSLSSAKYAVTNSFHGTVFCILLHRPFVSLPLTGTSVGMNDRLKTLLTYLGLENRIFSSDKTIESILHCPIDWDYVDKKLQEFRSLSALFLKQALSTRTSPKNEVKTICFQTNGGVNHDFGGLDRVTELLANYFESQGITVYYLSFTKREGTDNSRQYYLPDASNLRSTANIEYYNRFLQEKQVDVLINQEGNVNIALPCLLKQKPLLLTVLHFAPNYIPDYYFNHRISKLQVPSLIKKALYGIVCKTGLNSVLLKYLRNKLKHNYHFQMELCDQFIMLSDRFKKDMAYFFPNQLPYNVSAINNPSTFSDASTVDVTNKSSVVLYVGRMEIGQKRLDLLLRIWDKVVRHHPSWILKLVGDGPDLEMLQRKVVDLSIPNVSFEGVQNPRKYYEEASIFCLTSGAAEGWGMVLVEAQFFGCVPLAFNSYSSILDIIESGKTGFVIPAFDEDRYCMELMKLMDDDELRKKMAQNAIESSRRYALDTIGEKWLNLFSVVDSYKKRIKRN